MPARPRARLPARSPARRAWTCPVCGGGVAPEVERCPCKALPFVVPQPVIVPFVVPTPVAPTTIPADPWAPPVTITWERQQQPCMVEEFFRANPSAGMAGIACPCPRCATMCASGLQSGSSGAILSA